MTEPRMTIPINRAQRRALRIEVQPTRSASRSPLAPLRLLDNARPHAPDEKLDAHIKTAAAFARLRDGGGDSDDFDHVGMVLNIAKVRALDIDETLADMIERAQDAMQRCADRVARGLRYGFDGPGARQIADALDAAAQITDASSPLQMRNARRVVIDQILGKGAWRRVEGMLYV